MAREKVTVTLDRDKARRVRELLGVDSTSAAIDAALSRVLRHELLRRDVAAYRASPPTEHESVLARMADWRDIADDTDWDALYDDAPS
jgi:hypothetical protein